MSAAKKKLNEISRSFFEVYKAYYLSLFFGNLNELYLEFVGQVITC